MLVGILLGDGPSRQNHWQVSKYRGKPVLKHTLDAMCQSSLDYVIMVLGKDYHLILNRISIPSDRVRILMNHRFDRGLSSYLKLGLMSVPEEAHGIMVVPGEYPQLTPEIINQLAGAFRRNNRGIIIPVHDEERGFPVIFHRQFMENLKRVVKDDLGLSLAGRFPGEVITEQILSPAVINNFGKIRTTETSEIENLVFSKFEKDKSDRKRNDARVAVLEARKAAAVPTRTPEDSQEDLPEESAVEAEEGTPEIPESVVFEKPESPAEDSPAEMPEKSIPTGEVHVPRMESNKKQIIDKLKQKIEARVKEEKQKIFDRRIKDNEPAKNIPHPQNRQPVAENRPTFRPSEKPMEVPRHNRPQQQPARKTPPATPPEPKKSEEPKGADTGKLDPVAVTPDKADKNLSLKMLNDLLGRGKEKK